MQWERFVFPPPTDFLAKHRRILAFRLPAHRTLLHCRIRLQPSGGISMSVSLRATRILLATAAATLMIATAQAQQMGGTGGFGGHKHAQGKAAKTADPKPKVDEKAYAAALKSLPNKAYDPWNGVR
jgi:hypothetical protein